MPSSGFLAELSRRDFLVRLGTGALGFATSGKMLRASSTVSTKPLRGIFPITQTPFTETNQLDLDALVEEVKFIDRGRVHGCVWPQLASEWSALTEQERLKGMEAIASTGKGLRPAIVLGVQAPEVATAVKYAQHAERLGADAVISLPPSEQSDPQVVLEYYQAIGQATQLPLFVQAVGKMDVDLLLQIYETVPTMRYVKDEAGDPLKHIGPLRERTSDQIKVFSGAHGRKLMEEMSLGFSGSMPAAPLADLYAATWDLWHAGKQKEAATLHERTLKALDVILRHGTEGIKYALCLRGVFKTYAVRATRSKGFASAAKIAQGGSTKRPQFDESGKTAIREMLDSLKPYLRT